MEIKTAVNPSQSDVLNSLKSIDLIQYGVIAIGAITFLGYSHLSPRWKDEVTRNLGYLITGAGVGARVLSHVAKKGRIDMGDLAPEIEQRVNLTEFEAARLPIVQAFLKGEESLSEIPQVKTAIAAQVAEVRPDMHAQVAGLLSAQERAAIIGIALPSINVGTAQIFRKPQDAI
jgi:hypothetical protein